RLRTVVEKARLKTDQVEVLAEEEEQSDGREALEKVSQIREPALERPGAAAQHAEDSPDRVPEQGAEHEHEDEHGAGDVDVRGDGGLPRLRRLVGRELTPEMHDRPHAHRRKREQRAEPRQDEVAGDGPLVRSYAAFG